MFFARLLLFVFAALALAGCDAEGDLTPAPSAAPADTPAPGETRPPPPTPTRPPDPPAPTPRPVSGGTFTEGSLLDARTFNSLLATDPASQRVIALLGNRLVNVRPDLTPECDLCESWTVSPDSLVVTFTLRQGVTFHDGKPLTAEDVKFTYDALLDPARGSPLQFPLKSYLPNANTIKVINPATVQFTFARPKGDALLTDFAAFAILPKHLLGAVPAKEFDDAPFNTRQPVYSGPFMLKEWVKGERIVLAANPNYFKGKPYLSEYVIRVFPELTSLLPPLRDGRIDAGTLDASLFDQAKDLPNMVPYAVPSYRLTYFSYQMNAARTGFFQDPRVRQALLLALDRNAIVQRVLYGQGAVGATTIPPHSWAFNASAEAYRYNPERAKALLDAAGWRAGASGMRAKDGVRFAFTLLTNAGNRIREATVLEMQRYWQAVGIETRVQTEEWNAFLQRVGATPDSPRDFDMFLATYLLNADPNQRALWHSASVASGYNYNGYKNLETDVLIDEALGTFDLERRKAVYARLQEKLAADLPSAPLFFEYQAGVATRRLHSFTPAFAGALNNVHEWWLEPK